MKLNENRYTKKDDTEAVEYKVKKLNEFGEGLAVGEKFSIRASTAAWINDVTFMKDGKPKSFKNVKLSGTPEPIFENFATNDYGTGIFVLPESIIDAVETIQQGDLLTVWLEGFDMQKDGKTVKATKWKAAVNGEEVKKAKPVSPIDSAAKAMVGSAQEDKPVLDRSGTLPDVLKGDWLKSIVDNKEVFMKSFVDQDILTGVVAPVDFNAWIEDSEQCDTTAVSDLVKAGMPQEVIDMMKKNIFWGLISELGEDVI